MTGCTELCPPSRAYGRDCEGREAMPKEGQA
jgi:hypothetical protein